MRFQILISSEDTNVGLLGCNAVWACKYILTFWRNIMPSSSGLMMETIQYISPKRYLPTSQHGIKTQKTNTDRGCIICAFHHMLLVIVIVRDEINHRHAE
jgi:hypothetical protein